MKLIVVNMKGQETSLNILERIGNCQFDIYQDTEELNIWEKMGGMKDSIYIFGADGNLIKQLDPSDSDMGYPNPVCQIKKPEVIQILLKALDKATEDDVVTDKKKCNNEFYSSKRKIIKRKDGKASFTCVEKNEEEEVKKEKEEKNPMQTLKYLIKNMTKLQEKFSKFREHLEKEVIKADEILKIIKAQDHKLVKADTNFAYRAKVKLGKKFTEEDRNRMERKFQKRLQRCQYRMQMMGKCEKTMGKGKKMVGKGKKMMGKGKKMMGKSKKTMGKR